ncbi:MAG: GNAT family N-acetyltransferase [Acutalibacteraceae bacterium]
MKQLDVTQLSSEYKVRRMSEADIPLIYDLCMGNSQYYEYCGKQTDEELIRNDLNITPPDTSMEQKYYVGFFDGDILTAVMDLIIGYPEDDIAFIGFFMMNNSYQGIGNGSKIISEVISYLQNVGMTAVRLGIDKGNPQSTHFWKKNGFTVLKEIVQEHGTILYAERIL